MASANRAGCSATSSPSATITVERARMHCNDVLVTVEDGRMVAGGGVGISGCAFLVPIGVPIGEAPPGMGAAIRMSRDG